MEIKKRINSKRKGNSNELLIATLLSKRFGKAFKRVPMSGGWGTTNENTDVRQDAKEILSGDIICPPDFRFSIEVKSRKEFNFWDLLNKEDTEIDEWIKQAEREAKTSKKKFLLIVRINNKKPFAILKSDYFTSYVSYKDYTMIRLDYLLEMPDTFFFK
jgi:hypothetical protein